MMNDKLNETTLKHSIETGMKSLMADKFNLPSKLCKFEENAKAADKYFKPEWVHDMSSEDFTAGGIFTKPEADAIVFILAESGGTLDAVYRQITYGF